MSNEVMTKEKVQMDPKYIIELTLKLFVTCVVVAGLLGLVNSVTADRIAAIAAEKTQIEERRVAAETDRTAAEEQLETSRKEAKNARRNFLYKQ